ncbi:MAG: Xaa-Pro aminopeptidase, partial [Actinomycetia bacterium]|nr:Xaa-Pro aminopeptidase [Actinomycetes bacterium]
MRDAASRMIASTIARPEGAAIDFTRLRADRRRRLADAMAAADLDALVLGRPANAVYATGARQLWTAGARPFGPACVVVAGTGHVHLLSTWDEGVPAEIPHEDLYGLSWNPANIHASIAAVPGLGASRRVGTDSMGPGFPRLLASIAPDAEVVDATGALRSARSVKTDDEVACIVTAVAFAEAGLDAMVQALRPGVTERDLLAVHLERIAALGAPTPPSEGVACATGPAEPAVLRRVPSTRPIAAGDLVALDPGALFAGYEGGVGRTWPATGVASAAQRELAARA